MTVAKTCASVLALALFLHTGCDLFCQYAAQSAPASPLQEAAVPPCHHGGHHSSDPEKSDGDQTHKDCVHPQAADDYSKLQVKVLQANEPVALIEMDEIQVQIRLDDVSASMSARVPITPPGSPSTILRI
jgi:hypothetical protein